MLPPRLRLLLIPAILLSQCKTQKTAEAPIPKSDLTGDGALLKKFADWKPEEASWWSESGEDAKGDKAKKKETKMRRTAFEKRVTDSRKSAMFTQDDSWANREFRSKEFTQTKEKKTFRWPWSTKEAKTADAKLTRDSKLQEKVSRDAARSAREADDTNANADKRYGTEDFSDSERQARTFRNVPGEKAFKHDDPEIIRDLGSKQEADDNKLSISDIRKLLNKN